AAVSAGERVGAADGLVVGEGTSVNDNDAGIIIRDASACGGVYKAAAGSTATTPGDRLITGERAVQDREGSGLTANPFIVDGAPMGRADEVVKGAIAHDPAACTDGLVSDECAADDRGVRSVISVPDGASLCVDERICRYCLVADKRTVGDVELTAN